MRRLSSHAWPSLALGLALGCAGCAQRVVDMRPGDATADGFVEDAARDAGSDAERDAGADDTGRPRDSGAMDGSGTDSRDSGVRDSGADSGGLDSGRADSGASDSGRVDSGPPPDTGAPDTGPPPGASCLSGASGTHVVRFRWEGSTSGGTASVRHEANTLPDSSRWRVTAASSSIGYRPVFRDPFLGEGGLELSGTVFIDVELSTELLSSVSNATLAIYGRSYNTTTSGSFTWQTFSGTGASPRGGVANSAPYEWYRADATGALPAGDDGTLLRIRAGPPSSALIVNRVEICFDAR